MKRITSCLATAFLVCAATQAARAGVVPSGPEFQVNTYTTDFQSYPAVASVPGGGFVVVWTSYDQDFSYGGIFGQRYDSTGTATGPEFQANLTTDDDQYFPAAAADAAGNFVVVWTSYYQDGDDLGVFGQRFAADGSPLGGEFQVNSYTTGYQGFPDVATTNDGTFLVVWISADQDGSDFGVFGQRYDKNGDRSGSEFQVNSYTTDYQGGTSISAGGDGKFVVAWRSFGQDGDGYGVFAQRIATDGTPLGDEFKVNSDITGDQSAPDVAAAGNGNFVVVWEDVSPDGSETSVFGQRFDAAGNPSGTEFRTHVLSNATHTTPAVAAGSTGDFLVAWTDSQADGSNSGIFGHDFASDGTSGGPDFQVNTYTTGSQTYPTVAATTSGDFIVAWSSLGQDGDGAGVFARRFGSGVTPTPCVGDCSEDGTVTVDELVRGVNIALGNAPVSDCSAFDRNGDSLVTVDELILAVNAALNGCPV